MSFPANRRKVVSFEESRDGVPDGMCIDTDGKLWVAMFGTGQVLQVDPETGEQNIMMIMSMLMIMTSHQLGLPTAFSEYFVVACLSTIQCL